MAEGVMLERSLAGLLGMLILTAPVYAQATADQATLVFTVGFGYTGSTDLWSVTDQPLLRPDIGSDSVSINRDAGGSIGVLFGGIYFPKDNFGIAGEAFFLGIGVQDQCTVTSSDPSQRITEVCADIDGHEKSSSAVLLSVGPVFRAWGHNRISPYARLQVGALFSNLSTIRTEGTIAGGDIVPVYDDEKSTRITAGLVLGGGVTAAVGKGYQLRMEVRDNYVGLSTVAGPTIAGDLHPEVDTEYHHLWSVLIGFDVVLEKKRGRRY
jgi:hypothetical protein